jgi:hypothetical protein
MLAKAVTLLTFLTVLTAFGTATADPLPDCGPWVLKVSRGNLPSGTGTLAVTVDGDGNLMGTAFGFPILAGYYDDPANKLTFVLHAFGSGDPSAVQVYTGYLFVDPLDPSTFLLTGSFEAFQGSTFGTSVRSVFGWSAQCTSNPGVARWSHPYEAPKRSTPSGTFAEQ